MSFGDGNLHKRVDELENAYKLLQADFDITRERWMMRGVYIAKQRERVEALEELALDLYADLMEYGCTPNAHRANYKPRFEALGIEVDG